MEVDLKAYGKIYSILSSTIKRYYKGRLQNGLYSNSFATELRKKITSDENGEDFPMALASRMGSIVVHWFGDDPVAGFDGIRNEDEIIAVFQRVWNFQKQYISADRTDAVWEEINDKASELTKDEPKYVRYLYMAVVEEFDRLDKSGKGK